MARAQAKHTLKIALSKLRLHKIAKKGESQLIGGGCDEEAAADHRQTEPLLLFFPPPFLILIKVSVQDKQCLPTLQFKHRPAETRALTSKCSLTSYFNLCVKSMELDLYISSLLGMLPCYFSTSMKLYGASLSEQHTGPPEVLLPGLCTVYAMLC